MPLVDGVNVSPDDAMAAGRCPECGDDLKKQNPIAHRKSHWLREPPWGVDGDEARRRMAMFDKFIVKNKVTTTNMAKPKEPDPKTGPSGVIDPAVGA